MSTRASSTISETWPWPDSMDALAAAPDYHERLLENDRVRVLHTRIPAGASVPLHTHRFPGVAYILSWSDFIRRDHHGKVLVDSRQIGSPPRIPAVQWLDALPPHTVENVGVSEISILIVELKEALTTI
ncbi:MAG: hypothetical protein ABSH02_03460 [Candidatus Sulfotelmatobacter sp.]